MNFRTPRGRPICLSVLGAVDTGVVMPQTAEGNRRARLAPSVVDCGPMHDLHRAWAEFDPTAGPPHILAGDEAILDDPRRTIVLSSFEGFAGSSDVTKLDGRVHLGLLRYHSASFQLPGRVVGRLRSVDLARSFVNDVVVARAVAGEATGVVTRRARGWRLAERASREVVGRAG